MNKCNLYEVFGLSKMFPKWASNFKEINIQENAKISEDHNIDKILRTSAKVTIVKSKIVETKKNSSHEGQNIEEMQLNVYGEVIQNVDYIGTNNQIKRLELILPFYDYIVLDKTFDLYSKYKIISYIEDINLYKISEKNIYHNILFSIVAINLF